MPRPTDPILLHVAGATVVHWSPFERLEVPLSEEFLGPGPYFRWVRPLELFDLQNPRPEVLAAIPALWEEMDDDAVQRLFAEFDWRPRRVATLWAGLKQWRDYDDLIGRLLLRSDVCCVGDLYCMVLALFNTPRAPSYLLAYLGYYLTRPDLHFDQSYAMAAVWYLDRENGTDHLTPLLPLWEAYAGQPYGDPAVSGMRFVKQMAQVAVLAQRFTP